MSVLKSCWADWIREQLTVLWSRLVWADVEAAWSVDSVPPDAQMFDKTSLGVFLGGCLWMRLTGRMSQTDRCPRVSDPCPFSSVGARREWKGRPSRRIRGNSFWLTDLELRNWLSPAFGPWLKHLLLLGLERADPREDSGRVHLMSEFLASHLLTDGAAYLSPSHLFHFSGEPWQVTFSQLLLSEDSKGTFLSSRRNREPQNGIETFTSIWVTTKWTLGPFFNVTGKIIRVVIFWRWASNWVSHKGQRPYLFFINYSAS